MLTNMTEDYHEELYSLIIVGVTLLLSKIIACCYSLGLYQKHRQVNLRRDSLSLAKVNGLQIDRIADLDVPMLTKVHGNCLHYFQIPDTTLLRLCGI
jgi:hypothetical protein